MIKKGFTLIELLAVIVIISLIALFAFRGILKKSAEIKDISNKKVEELIISSAKSYIDQHKNEKLQARSGQKVKIPYSTLKNYNYLPDTLKNVKTYKNINISNYSVCVTYSNYKYNYTISTNNCQ